MSDQNLLLRQVCIAVSYVVALLSSLSAPVSLRGTFPKQIPLGARLVVWVESDIQDWISEQVSAGRG